MPRSTSASTFATRPYHVALTGGLPNGLGIRAGASIVPELGIDLRASTILLFQTYGADLVVRPLARHCQVTPTLRVGMSALQSNFSSWGGWSWRASPSASVGVEWRSRGGFVLGGDVGASAQIIPAQTAGTSPSLEIIPNLGLSVGYAF